MKKKTNLFDGIETLLQQFKKNIFKGVDELEPAFEISTGSLSFDYIVGGGICPGITEIYGTEGAGKSTIALSILAQAQKLGLECFYIDQERGITKSLLQTIDGLDLEKLSGKILRPNDGQEALRAIEIIVQQIPKSCIVLDSIPACLSPSQIKEAIGNENSYAPLARLMSVFLPKIKMYCLNNNCALILLNQIRSKIGVYYGNPEDTPGGKAIKFYCDKRIEVRKGNSIKKDNNIIGHYVKIKVTKNKYSSPFKTTEVPLLYGIGIDRIRELIQLGLQLGLIKREGRKFHVRDHEFTFEKNLIKGLKENTELADWLYDGIWSMMAGECGSNAPTDE